MLVWMCALHCEAKSVIDYYRLSKISGRHNFDIYQRGNTSCVVSGMGADNMAHAIHWTKRFLPQQDSIYWINLGIAGHKTFALGTAVLINRASSANDHNPLLVSCDFSHDFVTAPLISLSQPQTDYDEIAVFDLEAHTFFLTTHQFSTVNRCQSIKIISDNSETLPTRDKAWISQIIADNMSRITQFAEQLQKS